MSPFSQTVVSECRTAFIPVVALLTLHKRWSVNLHFSTDGNSAEVLSQYEVVRITPNKLRHPHPQRDEPLPILPSHPPIRRRRTPILNLVKGLDDWNWSSSICPCSPPSISSVPRARKREKPAGPWFKFVHPSSKLQYSSRSFLPNCGRMDCPSPSASAFSSAFNAFESLPPSCVRARWAPAPDPPGLRRT